VGGVRRRVAACLGCARPDNVGDRRTACCRRTLAGGPQPVAVTIHRSLRRAGPAGSGRDGRAVCGGGRAVAAGLHGVHRRPMAPPVPVLRRRHAAGSGRAGHLHGVAATSAAGLARPWRPPAAGHPDAGPAVCRGAGGHQVLGLPAADPRRVGAAAGAGLDRGAVRGGLLPRLPPGPPAGRLRDRAGRGRRGRLVCAVPRRLRHGPGRHGVLVGPGRGLRHRLPAGRQRAGAVAAADPAGWLVQLPGRRRLPAALGVDRRLRRGAGLMALVIWLAHKRQRRRAPAQGGTP
jgi:hypothetical protein